MGATGADLHVDALLSGIGLEAFQEFSDGAGLVGDQLFPAVPVGKQSDLYAVINQRGFVSVPDDLRAPGTPARTVEFDVSSDQYYAHNRALTARIPMEDIYNADDPFMLEENETRLVVGLQRLAQEVRIANICTSISNVGSGVALTGSNKWSDGSSNPIGDVRTAHAFIRKNTGLVANTAVIDTDTMEILRTHPQLLDQYKYTDGGQISMAQIASAFKVRNVYEAEGVREFVREGGTSSQDNIWGNSFVLAHVSPPTGVRTKTFGLRFQWRNPIFPAPYTVRRGDEDRPGEGHVRVLEAGYYQDEKVVARNLCYAITTTL